MSDNTDANADISQELLQTRWKTLSVDANFFTHCRKQPAKFIPWENYERKFYFYDCENISFQNNKGTEIWAVQGGGEIDVPAGVNIYIIRGKSRPWMEPDTEMNSAMVWHSTVDGHRAAVRGVKEEMLSFPRSQLTFFHCVLDDRTKYFENRCK
ncbi:hypothetical protein CGCFRS4_v015768 [Colletotrichum fructicola]|nr:hypothetical protein CGCFRS4_v015768 [Colletotrichum fructicola]